MRRAGAKFLDAVITSGVFYVEQINKDLGVVALKSNSKINHF
jgi:hypothetical protein